MPPKKTRRTKHKRTARPSPHWLTKITGMGLLLLIAYASFRLVVPSSVLGSPAPALPLWQAYWLRARLGRNIDVLTDMPGRNVSTEDFFVNPGETASAVSVKLAERRIIPDAGILRDYLVYKGLDSQIEAGFFQFRPTMTTVEVATALTEAMPPQVQFHMWAGWRLEQAADALSRHPHLAVDYNTFHALATRVLPLPGEYSFRVALPSDSTLEGYLYPGDYTLPPRATAPEVLSKMLSAFDSQANRLAVLASQQKLTLHEFVTLASIVQRESIRDSESPLIAGVFLNRLALTIPLSADPTTQYALATPDNWWPQIFIDPRLVQHPYNTYLTPGLPPGPIANPGAHALESAGHPAPTDFLYFRAACDESGSHNFSRTYREHLLWECGS